MPAKIDGHWVNRLVSLKSNNLGWGAVRLHTALWEEAAALYRTDAPSQMKTAVQNQSNIGSIRSPLLMYKAGKFPDSQIFWPF